MLKHTLLATATSLIAFAAQAQSTTVNYVNIGYPSTITVTPRVASDDPTHLAFVVDLNDETISSFHVDTNLSGEQHYGQTQARSTHDLTGPTVVYSTLVGAWTFEGNGGSFGWQSTRNQDKYQGLWVFEVSNANFNSNTQFTYWFDRAEPTGTSTVPEPASWAMALGALGVIALKRPRPSSDAQAAKGSAER